MASQPSAPSNPKPAHKISPLLPSEAHLYQSIRHETFKPTINKLLYSSPPSTTTLQKVISDTVLEITDATKGWLYMSCRDSSTSAMIAGARWRYVGPSSILTQESASPTLDRFSLPFTVPTHAIPSPRPWPEVEAGLTIPSPYPESNPEVFTALLKLFNDNRREILANRPHYVLYTLVTHPEHHRKGAGGLLVDWGCREADKRNVECYLEASPMGEPLYKRFGFERVKVVELDLGAYEEGGEVFEFILMRRPAKWERERDGKEA
ncbi:hypothetical protein BU24DRAFT_273462 [Aaosphaeria arxii CBS 175.79]|uniref:N-acetyltransferase domain-containing protein n=1 Tax=Aaosphaeria arxii CBS 175.79 TaxID=1450172 RepID=A0A6A5XHB4_9PLEO|nr:uncharacterized protein BU24DRAFT_273462 [Aaosphaeria arxii CBS 175.79]KAF2012269.1 hypothetical protein BU24DRAFT_273462 [Aaosphaeria arxii CBS 175.79]